MRTLGIMTAIAAGLYGVIWGLADYGFSTTCTSGPGIGGGGGYCYPFLQDLHPVIAPAALATAAVTVVVALTVAPHRARGKRQP